MLHRMKLDREPFDMIANGSKTVELRLFDEKRKQIKPGDFIGFYEKDAPDSMIQVRVTGLFRYDSFEELFENLPDKRYGKGIDAGYMERFYSRDEQDKYGVIGIEFRKTELQRFIDAQENGYDFGENYETAIQEIHCGEKLTHWIWYVFPQITGLGYGELTVRFSIKNTEEAADYYDHPLLGGRLRECCEALLELEQNDPVVVFGMVDALKLRSCMTLFLKVSGDDIFRKVLDKFCQGTEDELTLSKI